MRSKRPSEQVFTFLRTFCTCDVYFGIFCPTSAVCAARWHVTIIFFMSSNLYVVRSSYTPRELSSTFKSRGAIGLRLVIFR